MSIHVKIEINATARWNGEFMSDKVLVRNIGYEDLEQFKLLAKDYGIDIVDSQLVSYVSENQVFVGVKGDKLVGALIIDADNVSNCIGEVELDVYQQRVENDEVRL